MGIAAKAPHPQKKGLALDIRKMPELPSIYHKDAMGTKPATAINESAGSGIPAAIRFRPRPEFVGTGLHHRDGRRPVWGPPLPVLVMVRRGKDCLPPADQLTTFFTRLCLASMADPGVPSSLSWGVYS